MTGLTDIGAQLGDLKFPMSKTLGQASRDQAFSSLTPEEQVRCGFVIHASLPFDAKEITHQLHGDRSRISPHLKTIIERNIPWLEGMSIALPSIVSDLKEKDANLAAAFEQAEANEAIAEELAILKRLASELDTAMKIQDHSSQAEQDCARLIEIAKPLFPLFSRAKDALGLKKAQGAI